ncbi:MAG TPA: two-component system sensor histidine kinase RppB [Trichocoleus sp.]
MQHNRVFHLTRWRLTALYASTMSVILTASAFSFYWAMAQDHRREIDHRLESTVATLHDSLEPSLDEPGQISPVVWQLLPSLCTTAVDCSSQMPNRHVLGLVHQDGYYLRFLSLSGQVLAIAGEPPEQVIQPLEVGLHTLHKANGISYRQMSLLLKNAGGEAWGYLHVGTSLQTLNRHLSWVKWSMLVGLPLGLVVVWAVSWWVAGVAIGPAYRAYRQIQQFTADAAHELRTPLAAIRVSAESIGQDGHISEAEAQNMLQVVTRQNQRLTTLVNDLLILSRLEQADDRPHSTLVYLPDLISDIEEEFSAIALARGIKLTTDYAPSTKLSVRGNEQELYRVLLNLVSNAIEHTPEGGKVTLRLSSRERNALIEVEDTGIGIAPQDQAKIFDRFYRVNPDRSRSIGGSGLGLAIAQAIVQSHSGHISVKSELGKGSRFIVQLPKTTSIHS